MKIFLTGASGFIGRVASEHLCSLGHEVVNLYHTSGMIEENGASVTATLGDDSFVEMVLSNINQCDAIVHIAACINHNNSCPDLIQTNCLGMQQLMTITKKWDVQHFVYISSLPVIGKPQVVPIKENHSICPPTVYHATKLFGEQLLAIESNEYKSFVSYRVSAPVGFGMPDNRILSVFIQRALQHQPLILSGQGTRQQNYVDVRDVAHAIALGLGCHSSGLYSSCGARAISNRELAELCIEVLNSRSKIEYSGKPDPSDDEVWDVCIDSARKILGYNPQHDIKSTIRAVARKYEDSHN